MELLREVLFLFLLCGLFFIIMVLFYMDMRHLRRENELLRERARLIKASAAPVTPIMPQQARSLATDWIAAWNSHNLDGICSHYAEDVEFSSPFIVTLLCEPSGIIHGRENLRACFAKGLERVPDLHFELIEVFAGVGRIVIYYRGIDNNQAIEVMTLSAEGQIVRTAAHYKV